MRFPQITFVFFLVVLTAFPLLAQSPNGTINGLVLDPSNRAIASADILVINDVTGVKYSTKTNDGGIYAVPNLPPGPYRLQVSRVGFKTLIKPDIVLNTQDALSINFTLPVGATFESVTVEGGASLVNTESAAVSTVVDRQFAENLPMNGRSFQTLIQLTPGVILTASDPGNGGQFSVNGQRAVSNYWMVDGVSANFGIPAANTPGNGSAGALPSFSVLGGTNSLVSVDALQEFRIQTSTYAPEFGRTPGGQISIVTRSGTNQFHGTAFDYLRNDLLDASNWFNGYTNNPTLPKAKERQNDFGGTLSGPIVKSRTFFFFSYEALRLRLPQTTLTQVPDLSARQNASPALTPYLNAFPLDPRQLDLGNGIAQFNASYSNPASLDAYSLRVDHKLTHAITLFGRYNYSPSSLLQRGANGIDSLSSESQTTLLTQTSTAGMSWSITSRALNDFRFNYSESSGRSRSVLDNFGGAVPLQSLPFPDGFTAQNAGFHFAIGSLLSGALDSGAGYRNLQRQINLTDNFVIQTGTHSLKFGVDFRRMAPIYNPAQYFQGVFFGTVASAGSGNVTFAQVRSATKSELLFHNVGVFAQDTWKPASRLTVTYGLRWDVDMAPSSANGPNLLAVTGYNLNNLSNLALASPGTPPFKTTYDNLAPRIGVAYEAFQHQNWQTLLRGGFGVFYDLATSQAGNAFISGYPFGGIDFCPSTPDCPANLTFPLDAVTAAPPSITPAAFTSGSATLYAFDPNLKLPYTLEWNFAVEQGLGKDQALTTSYLGSLGRRLLQTADLISPNPNFVAATLVGNSATSDFQSLQVQFERRLSRGLQALASYSWSHSIDTGSTGAFSNAGNTLVPGAADQNRGPSDFDVRNAFSAGLTYEIPSIKTFAGLSVLLHGWSVQSAIQARSAPPEDVSYALTFNQTAIKGAAINIRPDVVPGIPLYLYGAQFPGGKAFNYTPGAVTGGCSNGSTSVGPFCPPPADANGNPLRQGTLGRNALRAFPAAQWDLGIHREFPIHESLKMEFRAELFNVLNHPNFGPPSPNVDEGGFGVATQMLGQSLVGSGQGNGDFNPLYQLGGPRSVQLALKLSF